MTSAKSKKSGVVFSVRYLDTGPLVSDHGIGTYEEQDNGDIKVSLEKLPSGGGHMLMRPSNSVRRKAKPQSNPDPT
jgi:hypothetical protein